MNRFQKSEFKFLLSSRHCNSLHARLSKNRKNHTLSESDKKYSKTLLQNVLERNFHFLPIFKKRNIKDLLSMQERFVFHYFEDGVKNEIPFQILLPLKKMFSVQSTSLFLTIPSSNVISSNFGVFSEYMNFTRTNLIISEQCAIPQTKWKTWRLLWNSGPNSKVESSSIAKSAQIVQNELKSFLKEPSYFRG